MIRCELIDDTLIKVNGKEVRQDMNGNWVGKALETEEVKCFNLFLEAADRMGGKLKIAAFQK